MGDPHNCSKHQIAKWGQKQQFRAASCVSAEPQLRVRKNNRRYAAEIAAPSFGAIKNRRFAAATWAEDSRDRSKRPAPARNQKQLRAQAEPPPRCGSRGPAASREQKNRRIAAAARPGSSHDRSRRPGSAFDLKNNFSPAMRRSDTAAWRGQKQPPIRGGIPGHISSR